MEKELACNKYEETQVYASDSNCKYLITDLTVLRFQMKWVSDALSNLINSETSFSACDTMFNLLARFGSRLPSTKRELVGVDSLKRVFDSSQVNTRIKGPRKLTWFENRTVVSYPAGESEPLRLYLCLSYLFHEKTFISTLFSGRVEVNTVPIDCDLIKVSMPSYGNIFFEIFEALSDSKRSGEDNLEPVDNNSKASRTDNLKGFKAKMTNAFVSVERLEA